jgi:hypothetical protein
LLRGKFRASAGIHAALRCNARPVNNLIRALRLTSAMRGSRRVILCATKNIFCENFFAFP